MDEPTLGALANNALSVGASGAVVAVRENSETAVGTAGDRMSTSTRFHVGSVGKTFLAALVLGLVDEGRLELDAPLALYLPDTVSNSGAIRLRHLLQHTSGLRDFLQEESFLASALAQPERRPEPTAVLELVADDPLFAPGTAWAYASTNYLVLALVVEAVEHVPLRETLPSAWQSRSD
jgi:D-alanyl-D-alanine carboxypeptidase